MATMADVLSDLNRRCTIRLPANTKFFAFIEPAAVPVLILCQEWFCRGKVSVPALLAGLIMIAGWIVRDEGARDIGLVSFRWTCIPISIFMVKMLPEYVAIPQKSFEGIVLSIIAYVPWATLQQLALNGSVVRRLKGAGLTERAIPYWAGGIFLVVHFPNFTLMVAGFFGGMAASWAFLRMERKNVHRLAFAQSCIAVMLVHAIPDRPHKFSVGPAYWR